jgi:hypothetical protein
MTYRADVTSGIVEVGIQRSSSLHKSRCAVGAEHWISLAHWGHYHTDSRCSVEYCLSINDHWRNTTVPDVPMVHVRWTFHQSLGGAGVLTPPQLMRRLYTNLLGHDLQQQSRKARVAFENHNVVVSPQAEKLPEMSSAD